MILKVAFKNEDSIKDLQELLKNYSSIELIKLSETSNRINAFKLKHYYGAKLSPFACLIDNNGKHIQAFYSENKSFSLDYIKNVLDHWLLYNPIEDGNSRN